MPRKKKEVVVGEVVENKKEEVVSNNTKPYFLPRFIAYIVDILIVSLVCTGIMYVLPKNTNYDKYLKEYEQIQADFIEEKISYDEYLNKAKSITYDLDYNNVISIIAEVVLIILYFVVFQFYNKGQTFGKKLMRLRVVSTKDGELTLNQVTYRALIINSILVTILMLAALLFAGRSYYYYTSTVLQYIAAIIEIATLIMILFRKDGRGLHDIIAGTKVIQEN